MFEKRALNVPAEGVKRCETTARAKKLAIQFERTGCVPMGPERALSFQVRRDVLSGADHQVIEATLQGVRQPSNLHG